MAEEFDDYRTDSVYEMNYTKEVGPQLMKFALALQGIAMPDGGGEPFRYLELGYGFGLSVAIHAAGYGGEFWGTDFMKEHAEFANKLGDAGGLDKHFLQKSFGEMDEMAQAGELPKFDVIAFHGIWSWVNAENKRHILNVVDRCLKPGGVVYNSYNTLPGWSYFMPVREIMRLNGERLGEDRPIEDRVKETLVYTKALADAGAVFFKANPAAALRLKGLDKMPIHYLAQEYFNRTWTPLYFADVAEMFGEIGCTFASSANTIQMTGALVPPETRNIVASMPNRQFRETLRDFAVNQSFRTDLFMRDPVRLNSREQKQAIEDSRLARFMWGEKTELAIPASYGKVTLDPKTYRKVMDALSENDAAPVRVGDLFARPGLDGIGEKIRNEIISVIVGMQWAWPAADAAPERAESIRKMNRLICAEAAKGSEMRVLASSVLGAGVPVGNEEMRFLHFRPEGENPDVTEWTRRVVDSHVRQGQKVNFTAAMEKIQPLLTDIFLKTRMPALERLGVTL